MPVIIPVDAPKIRGIGFPVPSGGAFSTLDTFNAIDLWALGFNLRPDIFYDPTASTSRNLGTFKNPYTTFTQVQRRCSGNMSGHVLGLKRGTMTRGALSLTLHGTSANAFSIVPYGPDEAPLPIINGGAVQGSWTQYSGDNRIWQATTGGTVFEAYENTGSASFPVYNRLFFETGGNLAAKIAAIQAYIAAPIAGTVGAYANDSNITYIYLRDGSNPNNNQIELASQTNALKVTFDDVSGTGYVTVCGINTIMTRDTAMFLTGSGNTNTPTNVNVVGCQAAHTGCVPATSLAADGFLIFGASNSARATACSFKGNYANDILNNAYEFDFVNSSTVSNNIGVNIGGNSILELFTGCSSNTITFNRGYNDPVTRTIRGTNYHDSGVWANGAISADGNTMDPTTTGTNTIAFNYIQDASQWGIDISSQNNLVWNNTILSQNVLATSGLHLYGGTSVTGNVIKNNLSLCNMAASFYRFARVDQQTVNGGITPITQTWDYNGYANLVTSGSGGGKFSKFPDGGEVLDSFVQWQTDTGGESHSLCSISTATLATGFSMAAFGNLGSNTDYSLSSNGFQGVGVSNAALNLLADTDGRTYSTSAPNMGALQM